MNSDFVDPAKLVVCVCTYRRVSLLKRLVFDLANQSHQPGQVIVVDGDPGSGEVIAMLRSLRGMVFSFIYVPSNHANLSYQRYLGWCVSKGIRAQVLLYLDDDLRLTHNEAVGKVVSPLFLSDRHVVGVTAELSIETGNYDGGEAVKERAQRGSFSTTLIRHFGAGREVKPGGLSASGHRVPLRHQTEGYASVEWMRGGVMAFHKDALQDETFTTDLFALDHTRCGLGEDTLLGLRIRTAGSLLIAFGTGIEHPSEAPPQAYPIDGYRFGYAAAYSRRLINDHFRYPAPPHLADRMSLLSSLLGAAALHWWSAISTPRRHRFDRAMGFTAGTIDAFFRPPSSKRLTPHIDWRADASFAIESAVEVYPAC